MSIAQPTTNLRSLLPQATATRVKGKVGRPVGSGTALKLTPEQALEYSSQRMSHGFLLVPDLQLLFNRGDQWVKDQINSGRLPAKRLGHDYIVTWEAVLQFIESLPEVTHRKPRRSHDPVASPASVASA